MPNLSRSIEPSQQGATAARPIRLIDFWNDRNLGDPTLLDQYSTNNVAFAIAWLAYRLRVTPNQLSVLSCVFASTAFGLALVLPAAHLTSSLLWLFGFAQLTYILDCADGQLARRTGRVSNFGAFLDIGMDVSSSFLVFGGVFALTYRHYLALNDHTTAHWILLVGFSFLLARSARFFVWQKFIDIYNKRENAAGKGRGAAHHVPASLMDYQTSLAAMLIFLISPIVALLIYGMQAGLLLAAYARYFVRAYRIEQSEEGTPPETAE